MNFYNLGQKFEKIAKENSNSYAIKSSLNNGSLTYRDLNCKANKIANFFISKGLKKNDVLCLSGQKNSLTFCFIIACLKLGVAYVMLDSSSPAKRRKKIIKTCQPKMLICSKEDSLKFSSIAKKHQIIFLSNNHKILNSLIERFDDKNIRITDKIDGDDPAYIMFTSGSTGFPKGAVISHANVLNFINWGVKKFNIKGDDVLTNLNPLFFDNSVFDIYMSLFSGACLVPISKNILSDPYKLLRFVDFHNCTIWFSVPTLLIYLGTLKLFSEKNLKSIKKFIFGGEAFPKEKLINLYKAYNKKAELFNVYGPTECTCICSVYKLSGKDFLKLKGIPPLGLINDNFDYLILDENNQMVKKGEMGELCLLGPLVGKGYYNDKKNTSKNFINNPLNKNINQIMYKTGDLVFESLSNNIINFKGRKDNQIKHMGYRIELEEIEYALNSLSYITLSSVFHQNIGGISKIHAAIAVERRNKTKSINKDLSCLLPNYMLPHIYHFEKYLPVNPNGKIDKNKIIKKYGNLKNE